MNTTIALASDHGGREYRERISTLLEETGYSLLDYGVEGTESVDYPDYAALASAAVRDGEADYGILVCTTGSGVAMVANKFYGVRAANCLTPEMARLAREHNDANVLTIGQNIVDWKDVPEIVSTFLLTEASDEERHRRRVEKIHSITGC